MVTPIKRLLLLMLLGTVTVAASPELRLGIIGLDSSHSVALTKIFNDASSPDHIPGARVVAAWKGGSPDVKASASRVEGFTAEMRDKFGVTLCASPEDVVRQVDAVMILTVDGRTHLDLARRLLTFHKPVFVDKPVAGTLRDAIQLYQLAQQNHVPCFSSSLERFTPDIEEQKHADIGRLIGVFSYGPAPYEPYLPDLYWYGIHAVEKAYALMGRGCVSVVRTSSAETDVVTGVWSDGRVATVFGYRNAKHVYETIAFGTKAIHEAAPTDGYGPLAREILKFFQTGIEPVSPAETIELMTFMEAADESKRRGGVPVSLADVLRANGGADGI